MPMHCSVTAAAHTSSALMFSSIIPLPSPHPHHTHAVFTPNPQRTRAHTVAVQMPRHNHLCTPCAPTMTKPQAGPTSFHHKHLTPTYPAAQGDNTATPPLLVCTKESQKPFNRGLVVWHCPHHVQCLKVLEHCVPVRQLRGADLGLAGLVLAGSLQLGAALGAVLLLGLAGRWHAA